LSATVAAGVELLIVDKAARLNHHGAQKTEDTRPARERMTT